MQVEENSHTCWTVRKDASPLKELGRPVGCSVEAEVHGTDQNPPVATTALSADPSPDAFHYTLPFHYNFQFDYLPCFFTC